MLRRSPLKTYKPLRAKNPLRAKKPMKRTRPKPRTKEAKNYISLAMTLACQACNLRPSVDPHHPKGHAFGTGTSLKSSDFSVIPLCKECHDEYHQHGRTDFEDKYGTQQSMVEKTQLAVGYVKP